MKKLLCLLITAVLLLSTVTVTFHAADVEVTDDGADVEVAATGGLSLQQLKNKFPNGAYWNHVVTDWSNNGDQLLNRWDDSFADSYTWSPCATHNGTASVGQIDCNVCYGAMQCKGFVNKLSYDAYGSYCVDWGTTSAWNCKKGDVIHYFASDTDSTWGHWVMVIGRIGDTVYFGEANRDGNCKISWGREMYIGSFSRSTCYSAPWELADGSIPDNIWIKVSQSQIPTGGSVTFTCGANNATGFTIGIDCNGSRIITENISSGKTYTLDTAGNYSAYVTAHGSGGSADSSAVTFKVFSPLNIGNDFYAKIITAKNGLAVGADSTANVSVQTRDESDNQKWHFQRNSDGSYRVLNTGQNKSLDLDGATANFNENIHVYSSNTSNAQKWYLKLQTNGITFIPKCNTASAMDISGGSITAGTNIRDFQDNGTEAQNFTVEYTDLQPTATQSYNGHTYEFYDVNTTWMLAYKTCARLGGHLVTISSQQENDVVLNLFNQNTDTGYLWLGATDERSEGKFTWVTDESFSYSNWNSGQPDNNSSTEHYLQMYDTGKWNDLPNEYNKAPVFICEYDNTDVDADKFTPSNTTTYQSTAYEYYNTAVTWQTAKSICEAKGGHLLIIDNEQENSIIKQLISDAIWLGISDLEEEGVWKDIYGRQISYAKWKTDEPNNYMMAEDYGELYTDGTWNDIKTMKCGFVCEYNHADCDHVFSEKFVEASADGEQGYIFYECTKCGDSYKDNYMDYKDGWYTPANGSSNLPDLIKNDDKYTKQYHNYSEKIQTNSPGAGWVNKGVDHRDYVNDGGSYESQWELSTSNTRVLLYDYYYHFCIPGSGINSEANYEQSGNFSHFDSVSSSQVSVVWTGDDNGHTVYVLNWGDGSTVYCKSGTTCDGAWGTHGERSKAWYKMYVYQNKKEVIYYKWVKDSGWTDAPDTSADKTTVRFQVNADPIFLGDANGDGDVDSVDATIIQRVCTMIKVPYSEEQLMCGDVDGDGSLTIVDATFIQRYSTRVKTPYNIGEIKQ